VAAEYFLTALRSIGQNKVRALLTTLGVIIGVMSVILLIALGESAQAYVSARIRDHGQQHHHHHAGQAGDDGPHSHHRGQPPQAHLRDGQGDQAQGAGVSGVCANSVGLANMKYRTRQRSVMCIGTTPDWETIRELHTQVGRFITQQDVDRNNKVVIIGTKLKQELFGESARALRED
jgi:putative ABC transport system permease protein